MLKLKALILEGAYESATRNELAIYIGVLTKQRDHYTQKGNQAMVKLLNSDIDEVKAVLKKKGGGSGLDESEAPMPLIVYKDKSNANFLYIKVQYTTGASGGFLSALGSDTMSGQDRKRGQQSATDIANNIAKELEKQYNIEDIEVEDLENGKVQIFAVSDDFINVDPKTDAKLKTIVNKFKHKI